MVDTNGSNEKDIKLYSCVSETMFSGLSVPRHNFPSFYPFPKRQILDSSKLKEFADDGFRFDENVRKSSKRVENTVGKREIARYEQFLLFPRFFQKIVPQTGLVWEKV